MQPRKFQILCAALEAGVTGVMMWYALPAHQRRRVLMRLARQGQTAIQWAARMTSRYAMRCELAGDVLTATAGYELAHRLMDGPYQFAQQKYDDLRG